MSQGDGAAGHRPEPTFSSVTPSGIEIRYFAENKDLKVKRHYEIRKPQTIYPQKREWHEVPSVSTIIDEFKDSGGLIVWAQKLGAKGTLELYRKGLLRAAKLETGESALGISLEGGFVLAGEEHVYQLMQQHGLLTDDEKKKGGDKGQRAHDALELWAKDGTMPDPSFFPEEEQGYIEGLRMFLVDLEKCEPEVIATERMIASVEHGFAGRYDLEVRTHKAGQIVKRWMPKRGPQYATLRPGLYVPDLKTSKGVYKKQHFPQLEGYEIGRRECGYEPSDARGVIHVHPGDPKLRVGPNHPFYEFVPSTAKPSSFLATLALFNEYREIK